MVLTTLTKNAPSFQEYELNQILSESYNECQRMASKVTEIPCPEVILPNLANGRPKDAKPCAHVLDNIK